ncbi:MAG TPA: carboxypeptidase-like regulatory domain-containing protein, partial [Vicinamibacterales bacterium]|nr:carboxypeptidase-like regulatory domain-containing protein [Vicinamibacterales bacterium]
MRRTLRRTLVVLALGVAGSVTLLAQQPAPSAGSGFISGQVVEGGGTRAVPGATVTLYAATPRGPAREVIADAQGRYVFSGLHAGEFRLTARKTGWRAGAYGLATPAEGIGGSGDILTLAAGERARATVPVWRSAIIRGRVIDESGEPLAGARVSALSWNAVRARRVLSSGGDLGITDDRGDFTMSVRPGEYMIAASSEQVRIVNGRPHVFRQTFFPDSSATLGAAAIAVKGGEERSGIAIQMSLEPAFRVTGVLHAVDAGRMPQRLELLLVDREVAQQYPTRAIDAQGRFAFDNIPPGSYILRSPPGSLGSQDASQTSELWTQVALEVTDRDLDVSANAHRRLLVSGRVHFDGARAIPGPTDGVSVGVRLFREDELPLTDVVPEFVPVGPDGTFSVAVTPGRYVVSTGGARMNARADPVQGGAAARAWTLRSATSGDRDAADIPFVVADDLSGLDLTLTDAVTALRGRVTSRQGSVDSTLVMVFPVDEAFWVFTSGRRVATRRPSPDGSFDIRNLPEGRYFVAAVRGGPNEYEARNPALFEVLARTARRVTVMEGETTAGDVDVITSPAWDVARLRPSPAPVGAERAFVRDVPAVPPAEWATISGTVVATGSNAPIAGARVGLTPGVGGAPNIGGTYTDSQGRFTLGEVPAGQHTLYVSKPLYVSTVYGAATPADPGTPVTVIDGQRLSGLTIAMLKGAAIGGTVTDQNGQPLPGVRISVRAYRWTAGGRELVAPRAPTIFGAATTNLRGEYRTYGLAPGEYIVQAAVQGAVSAMALTTQADIDAATKPPTSASAVGTPVEVIYTPMFYPNTPDPAAAQTLRLGPGDEQVIDFEFGLMPTVTVSGFVRTPDGVAPNRLGVNLSQNDPLGPTVPRSRFAAVDASGAFTIRGVPPGRHLLTTSQVVAGSSPLAGALDLFIDRDVTGIVLDAVPMGAVTGSIRGESISSVRQPTVRLSLSPLPGTPAPPNQNRSAAIGADNRFSIGNVPPGRYRLELTGPNSVVKPRVASQVVAGKETADAGLEVK